MIYILLYASQNLFQMLTKFSLDFTVRSILSKTGCAFWYTISQNQLIVEQKSEKEDFTNLMNCSNNIIKHFAHMISTNL